MPKITEYEESLNLSNSDLLIIETAKGTQTIDAELLKKRIEEERVYAQDN